MRNQWSENGCLRCLFQIPTESIACTCVCPCTHFSLTREDSCPTPGGNKNYPVRVRFSTQVKRIDDPHSRVQPSIFVPHLKHFSHMRKEVPLTIQCLSLLLTLRCSNVHQDFPEGAALSAPACSTEKWHLEWASPCHFSPYFGTHKNACQTLSDIHGFKEKKKITTLLWKTLTRKGKEMPADKCTGIGFLLLSNSQIYSWGSWPISMS